MNLSKNIFDLPPEIMGMIFRRLPSTKDLINCNKTCIKWKNIIQAIFKDKGTTIHYAQVHFL